MSFYMGPVGNLQAFRAPEYGSGYSPKVERIGQTKQLLGGGRVRHTTGYRKTIGLSFQMMTLDEYGVLEGLYLGAFGPGPYVYIDPTQRNLLTRNQSSGTDALQTTDGFFCGTSGTLVSDNLLPRRGGVRRLRYISTSGQAPGTPVLATGSGTMLDGTLAADWPASPPASSGQVMTGSAYVYSPQSTPLQMQLRFNGVDGSYLSSSTASFTASSAGMVRQSVTGTIPAGSATVRLAFFANGTFAAGDPVVVDSLQLELATTASPWVVGSGTPRVFIDSLIPAVNVPGYVDAAMTLVEV